MSTTKRLVLKTRLHLVLRTSVRAVAITTVVLTLWTIGGRIAILSEGRRVRVHVLSRQIRYFTIGNKRILLTHSDHGIAAVARPNLLDHGCKAILIAENLGAMK